MTRLIYNSNKAMVAYLVGQGCKPRDVKIGDGETLLFGFDPAESELLAKKWFAIRAKEKKTDTSH